MTSDSRYDIPGLKPNHLISVGWDAHLITFYAQVFDSSSEHQHEPILGIGREPMQIPTLEMLVQQLAPFASIPPTILQNLQQDHDRPWSPSPLQLRNRKLYENTASEDTAWNTITAEQFAAGYPDTDAIYDQD